MCVYPVEHFSTKIRFFFCFMFDKKMTHRANSLASMEIHFCRQLNTKPLMLSLLLTSSAFFSFTGFVFFVHQSYGFSNFQHIEVVHCERFLSLCTERRRISSIHPTNIDPPESRMVLVEIKIFNSRKMSIEMNVLVMGLIAIVVGM